MTERRTLRWTGQMERFAAALASGRDLKEAALENGYAPTSTWPGKLWKIPQFHDRVATLAAEIAKAGPDLAPVIVALMDGADAAMESAKSKGSAAAFGVAKDMLTEAGRLKQALARAQSSSTLREWAGRWVKD